MCRPCMLACMHGADSRTADVPLRTKTPSRIRKSAKPGGRGSSSLRNVRCSKAGYQAGKEHAASSCGAHCMSALIWSLLAATFRIHLQQNPAALESVLGSSTASFVTRRRR